MLKTDFSLKSKKSRGKEGRTLKVDLIGEGVQSLNIVPCIRQKFFTKCVFIFEA